MKKYLYLPVFIFLTVACVSKKKFDELTQRKSALEVEKSEKEEENKILEAELQELNRVLGIKNSDLEKLHEDTTQLNGLYRELIKQYKSLSKISEADAQNLSKQLERVSVMRRELERKDSVMLQDKKAIEKLRYDLISKEKSVDSLSKNLVDREKRVHELEKVIHEREEALSKIRDQISHALLKFNKDQLTVEVINGKVYVSMSEQLLFKSGSYKVDALGKDALSKLGNALKGESDFEIMVEGHTDDVPMIGSGDVADNWDLSVLRATNITKELIKAGVEPKKVVPAGRGEFLPKVTEKTKEARAKNRRTEIIITPNLAELYNLIEKK